MVSRVLVDRRAVAEVATEMGVSRRTVYKWVQRYCEGGEAALQDGSSEPGVLHHQLGQDWVDLIVELRTEYKMTSTAHCQAVGSGPFDGSWGIAARGEFHSSSSSYRKSQ